MTGEQRDDPDARIRAAFAPCSPPPPPVPPIEWELARIEAAAGLVHEIVSEKCRHCHAEPAVISVWQGTCLARAVELRHESGCPDAD